MKICNDVVYFSEEFLRKSETLSKFSESDLTALTQRLVDFFCDFVKIRTNMRSNTFQNVTNERERHINECS
jgi:hypothetical protein